MPSLFSLLLVLAACCAVRARPQWRIINGTVVRPSEFPEMVSLQLQLNGRRYPFCGGTLLGPRTVLTAAHCFNIFRPPRYNFLASMGVDLRRPESLAAVTKVTIYPNFTMATIANDFAIVHLDRALSYISFARLPVSTAEEPRPGQHCQVVGWGATRPLGGSTSSVLMRGAMRIITREQCRRQPQFARYVTARHVCAESAHVSTSACKGDSGGPLFCPGTGPGRHIQVGVVSFGLVPCGQRGVPVVYGRVAAALPWIRANM